MCPRSCDLGMAMSLLETNWPNAAKKFSELIRLEDLHPDVVAFLSQNTSQPWAISCSGGSDSLALLLLLHAHFPNKREGLHVLHYNHKLRGSESDSEALFVESCAKSLELPFILGEGSSGIKNKSEAALRKNRHQFFSQSLSHLNSQILLLGHQRDDVAETILMRLARGSGTAGLCAPRPLHHFKNGKVHLRPLTNIGKEHIVSALEEVGAPWCNDSSNDGEYYLRNRIRRNVIPDWVSSVTGDLWKGIERSRALLEEDDAALEQWLECIFKDSPIVEGFPLNLYRLSGLPKALYRRALHKWLQLNKISKHFNSISFSSLLDNLLNSKPVQISAGNKQFVTIINGFLCLTEAAEPFPQFSATSLSHGTCISLSQGKSLKAEEIHLTTDLKQQIFKGKINPNHEVYLNIDYKNKPVFHVRLWRPGDRYKALGAPGTRKLQDMFVDKKISLNNRRSLPVIYEDSKGIAWCPGLPIAEPFKIEDNTQCALKLTFR